MTDKRMEFRSRLNEVFQDVFADESIEINDATSAADIEEWDSLSHISLVIATEKAFKVRLHAADVAKLANVGAMIDLLMTRA